MTTIRLVPKAAGSAPLLVSLLLGMLLAPPQASRAVLFQETKLRAADGTSQELGWALAASGDRLVVGAHDDDAGDHTGAVYVFERDGAGWVEKAKLLASDAAAEQFFGWSVAIDGDRLVVGAPGSSDAGDLSGAAYVFEWDGLAWRETAKLVASDASRDDVFGWSVAIDGDWLAVGLPWDDHGWDDFYRGANAGSVFVFHWDGVSWTEAKLAASDGGFKEQFGYSLALSGTRLVVGAFGDSDADTRAGAVYVFERRGVQWIETAKLLPSDPTDYELFGSWVATSGDRVAVGSPRGGLPGRTGVVYVFEWDGVQWAEMAKLLASDREESDGFYIVAISGDRVLVGATGDDDKETGAGAVYVFDWDGAQWVETAKLLPSVGVRWEWFGASLAFLEDGIVVGAPATQAVDDSGAVYIFGEPSYADDYEDGILPTDWTFERGSWEESGGDLIGVPDDAGSGIKARAIARPAFGGCDVCTVRAQLASSETFGDPAEIHVRLLGWYVDLENRFSVTLKPAQDRVVVAQKEGGATLVRDTIDVALEEEVSYEVRAAFDGAEFQVFLEGVLLHTQASRFASPPFGTVGVQSRNSDVSVAEVAVFP